MPVPFLSQRRAPLFEALKRHIAREYAGFHFPAHGGGRGLPPSLAGGLARLDLTELPGLDDLHAPSGPIARAQELAAALYGADRTFFLVNGSTVGLQALLLAAAPPGRKVLVLRNTHRAVVGGLILSGADPVYLTPPVSAAWGFCLPPGPDEVRAVLAAHPEPAAVIWTHPDYHGLAMLTPATAAAIRGEAGRLLLVDEAHGAHLPFHPDMPAPALSLGAAAVVQSAHKLGGALTQASWLHLKGPLPEASRVARALTVLQTSSPSYLLMASLDLARRQLALSGARLVGRAVELAHALRRGLSGLDGLKVLQPVPGQADPTKVVVSTGGLGLSGYRAAAMLRREYGLQVEMAGAACLLLVVGLGARAAEVARALRAFRSLVREHRSGRRLPAAAPGLPPPAEKVLTPRESWLTPARPVAPEEAAGLIAAETVSVSPPGIPIVFPGEKLTPEVIEYILEIKARGFAVQAADPGLASIMAHCE